MDVSKGSRNFLADVKDKLIKRGRKLWKGIYGICMTDDIFKNREKIAAGYLEGIMILSYDLKPDTPGADPKTTPKKT